MPSIVDYEQIIMELVAVDDSGPITGEWFDVPPLDDWFVEYVAANYAATGALTLLLQSRFKHDGTPFQVDSEAIGASGTTDLVPTAIEDFPRGNQMRVIGTETFNGAGQVDITVTIFGTRRAIPTAGNG